MAVVLREEVSLAEVSLGEIVVAYLEHLDSAGELDLDRFRALVESAHGSPGTRRRVSPGGELTPGDDAAPGAAAAGRLLDSFHPYRMAMTTGIWAPAGSRFASATSAWNAA